MPPETLALYVHIASSITNACHNCDRALQEISPYAVNLNSRDLEALEAAVVALAETQAAIADIIDRAILETIEDADH